MSFLESCNHPPLVASFGAVAVALLPTLEQACQTTPWGALKWANAGIYALNVFATSRPGRFDTQPSKQLQQATPSRRRSNKKTDQAQQQASVMGPRGRSLLAPAGWAFSIWLPIFTGEMIASVAVLFLKESNDRLVPILRRVLPGAMVAQICQVLWTAAARPRYEDGPALFIAAAFLTAAAYSLNRAYQAFTSTLSVSYNWREYLLFFLPLSLHFGWISAASLVNWNSSLAVFMSSDNRAMAVAGHASVVAATALGAAVTLSRHAPVYGAVIAWALTAVASTMQRRLVAVENTNVSPRTSISTLLEQQKRTTTRSLNIQLWLCRVGAICSGAASVLAASHPRHTRGNQI
jgi:hypothetical protein